MAAPMNEDADLLQTDDYYAWLGLSKEVRFDNASRSSSIV